MIQPATTDHASTASADSAWTLRDYALIADGERGALNRSRHRDKPLGHAEGGFLLCGFTMALAAHAQGLHPEAARWSEHTRSACGPTGLFAEEYDVAQRQLRGQSAARVRPCAAVGGLGTVRRRYGGGAVGRLVTVRTARLGADWCVPFRIPEGALSTTAGVENRVAVSFTRARSARHHGAPGS